jgi:uncharacterized protein YraI
MKFAAATIIGAASLAALAPMAAQAQQVAFASNTIVMRAGPDRMYPPVATIPAGMQVTVEGCLSGYRWCDVIAGLDRGWVWSGNLNYPYQGSYVALPSIAGLIGLGIVGFALNDYWSSHYSHRPFYAQRYEYLHRAPSVGYYSQPRHYSRSAPVTRYQAPQAAIVTPPRQVQRAAPRHEERRTNVMGGPPARVERAPAPQRIERGPARGQGHGGGGGHGRGNGRDRDH